MTDRDRVGDRLMREIERALELQRIEQILSHHRLERLLGDALDDSAGERKAVVAVRPELARRGQLAQGVEFSNSPRERVVADAIEVFEAVAFDTTGVGQEVAQGDGLGSGVAGEFELGQIRGNRRVERQLAFGGQLHDQRRGEDFRDRADLEQRLRRHRLARFEARNAVATGVDVSVVQYGNRCARHLPLLQRLGDLLI
jgi:hypothetical protein